MLDINMLDDSVREDIMENRETEDEQVVANMTPTAAMDCYLIWNGIQGFTESILDAYDSIMVAHLYAVCRKLAAEQDWDGITEIILEHGTRGDDGLVAIFQACQDPDLAAQTIIAEVLG